MAQTLDPVPGLPIVDAKEIRMVRQSLTSHETIAGLQGVYNLKASNSRRIRAATMGAIAGTARGRVITASDSLFAGHGALNDEMAGARPLSWPSQFAALMESYGCTVYSNWAGGEGINGGTKADYLEYDPSVTMGSAVSLDSTFRGVAGRAWNTGSDTTNGYIELTPGVEFDLVDVIHARASGTGSFRLLDQAAAQQGSAVNTAGVNAPIETTVSFAAGSTKARAVVTAGFVLIGGMQARSSTKHGIEVINTSISGVETNFFLATDGNSWMAHRPSISAMFRSDTKNVFIIGGGFNDMYASGSPVSLATVQARLRLRIQHAQSLPNPPDIIVMGYPHILPTTASGVVTEDRQQAIDDALYQVAVEEFDLPYVSWRENSLDAATAVAHGQMASDLLHPRAAGYSTPAMLMRNLFIHSLTFAA